MHRILTLLSLVALFALLLSGCSSDSSSTPIVGVEDTTPPVAPINLTAFVKDGVVTLAWVANSEIDLDSYNVYKADYGCDYELQENALTARFVETITEQALSNLHYRISATDISGNESAFSTPIQVIVDNTLPIIEQVSDGEFDF